MKLSRTVMIVICLNCLFSANVYSQPSPIEGKWYGFTNTGMGVSFKAFQFLSEGVVLISDEVNPPSKGIYNLTGKKIKIEIPANTWFNKKPIIITGKVVDDKILEKIPGTKDISYIHFERSPTCRGLEEICGSGVLCHDPDKGSSYWKPSQGRQSLTKIPSLSEFDRFYEYFNCAINLKHQDVYMAKIRFPLQIVFLKKGSRRKELIKSDTFNIRMIYPEKDLLSQGFIESLPMTLEADRVSVYRYYRASYTEMEWIFEKHNGNWALTGVEQRDTKGPQVPYPWYQLKKCNPNRLSGFEEIKQGQNEDFEEFVNRFYCSMKEGISNMYFERIKFPLLCKYFHTEGEDQGLMLKKDFNSWHMSAVDGGEAPLSYSYQGKEGQARIESHSTGMSFTWYFELDGSKWYLVKADIGGNAGEKVYQNQRKITIPIGP